MAQSAPLTYGIHLTDEGATTAFGGLLAAAIQRAKATSMLLTLTGDLGAGKTSLARGLIRGLGHEGSVPSPTYALLEPYHLAFATVTHLDLYRLEDASELEFLGWRDLGDSIRIVEWPERVPELAAEADLDIRLRPEGEGRAAMGAAGSPIGQSVLQAVLTNQG